MNNYELHEEATRLMDTTSHYELARKYLMMAECYGELLKSQPDVYELKDSNEKLTGMFKELESIVNRWGDRG